MATARLFTIIRTTICLRLVWTVQYIYIDELVEIHKLVSAVLTLILSARYKQTNDVWRTIYCNLNYMIVKIK